MITNETQYEIAEKRRKELIQMIILSDNLKAELDRLSRETAQYDINKINQPKSKKR